MSSVQTLDAEREKLDEVAKTYRAKGYAVTRRPAPEHLPSFLHSLSPDLLVEGNDESVVVCVTTTDYLQQNEQLEGLAERIKAEPDWRFELHVTPPSDPEAEDLLPSLEVLQSKSRSVVLLGEKGHGEDAFLICWSLVEALLRHLALQNDVDLDDLHPGDIVKRLYMDGIIEESTMNELIDAVRLRNRLVHGLIVDGPVPMQSLMKTANGMYRRVGEAPDDGLFAENEYGD
jgi:hypothetical protein